MQLLRKLILTVGKTKYKISWISDEKKHYIIFEKKLVGQFFWKEISKKPHLSYPAALVAWRASTKDILHNS